MKTYKLIKDISELTLEEKLSMINEINSFDGEFEYLDFQCNDEEFFDVYFKDAMDAVRATFYGNYRYCDEYVRFNAYGNVDSFNEFSVEIEIDNYIDEIIERYIELLNSDYVDDWQGLFESVEVES